jgi:DNA polymerase III subunit alpha
MDGEDVKPRIEDVELLDEAAAKQKHNLNVFLRDDSALASLSERFRDKGEGRVSLVMILEEGAREVEIELPGRYAITPQSAAALRAVPGVVSVELV